MRKHALVLTTTAAILACGAIAASAQAPGAQTAGTQQSSTSGPMQQQDQTRLQRRAEAGGQEDSGKDNPLRYHRGMMGPGMMGGRIIGGGYGHQDWFQRRGAMSPTMMHIIFGLMDADGDGKLTLQEWQAAHERIFKAMDADHDGTVTLEEMQAFFRGH